MHAAAPSCLLHWRWDHLPMNPCCNHHWAPWLSNKAHCAAWGFLGVTGWLCLVVTAAQGQVDQIFSPGKGPNPKLQVWFLSFSLLFFWDRVLLCSPGWPPACEPRLHGECFWDYNMCYHIQLNIQFLIQIAVCHKSGKITREPVTLGDSVLAIIIL
jgi:hypothetical protein